LEFDSLINSPDLWKKEITMKDNREIAEDRLENCETQLRSFKSYLTELKSMTAKHGTDKAQFEEDLLEVETNVKYYEGEVAQLKQVVGKSYKGAGTRTVPDSVLPRTKKQGIGSFVLSTISFISGVVLGSKLKARQSSKDAPNGKERVD
jgi:hypothetical protein